MVKEGDIVQIRKGVIKYKYKVLKIAEKRMGANMVLDFIKDITPHGELEKLKTSKSLPIPYREKGKGRPTKKERRIMDKVHENTK